MSRAHEHTRGCGKEIAGDSGAPAHQRAGEERLEGEGVHRNALPKLARLAGKGVGGAGFN